MNLKELSQTLGLSQTTVSRALNGYPEVSAKTRARVAAAAKEYGYIPNSRATGLATGRAHTIGHILAGAAQREIVNPIFGDFVAGANETYAEHGYDMLFSRVADQDELTTYKMLQRTGKVDGLVIQGPMVTDERIEFLHNLGMPFIVHGRSSEVTTPYSWVDVNNRRAFERATDFLLDLGHRRIALINGLEVMDFAKRRRDGYIAALTGRGVEIDPEIMSSAEMTEVFGHHETKRLLQLKNAPTAIVTSSFISALGVQRAINEAGLTIGKDISVITHDDELSYLQNGQTVPIFTATRSSVHEAGRRLANILISLIEDPGCGPKTELLEAELVVGRSTGPCPTK